MNSYYVIAPDGQRYGPADMATLNQWAQEGRLAPNSLLQETVTNAQIVARAVPGLNFLGGPTQAPAGANPYDMPNPVLPPNYQPYGQQPWHKPAGVNHEQFIGAIATTVLAPIFLIFCWVGLGLALFGCFTGAQLLKENRRASGITLLVLNICWIIAFIVLNLVFRAGTDS